jgi:gluconate 2-dehydrogenase gamma chain
MPTRRETLVTFGAAWATLTVPAAAAAQALPAPGWTPRALSPAQARRLDLLAELIMPATDTPGARDAGVPAFIDRTLADWSEPDQVAIIRAGLERIEADAQSRHGRGFLALSPDQQANLLRGYDAEARGDRRHFFAMLRELTTIGYFTSEAGATKALRYDPVPGAYRACVPLKEIGRAWAT